MLSIDNGAIETVTREVVRRLISRAALAPAEKRDTGCLELPVQVGVSVRHIHLCPEHIVTLFGEGHDLQVHNELYQKGYYAAKEQLIVAGPKSSIEKVRVLGPPRAFSQVELSQTDALAVGLKLPIATEGIDEGTQPVTLIGPEGTVRLLGGKGGGAFIARRHIHLSDTTAAELGVRAGDTLDMRVDGPRPVTLHDVLVRVRPGWLTEVHVDTDEANAAGIRNGQICTLLIPRSRSRAHG